MCSVFTVILATLTQVQAPLRTCRSSIPITVAVVLSSISRHSILYTPSSVLSYLYYPVFYAVSLYALPLTRPLTILVSYTSDSDCPILFCFSPQTIAFSFTHHIHTCCVSIHWELFNIGIVVIIANTHLPPLIVLCTIYIPNQPLSWPTLKKPSSKPLLLSLRTPILMQLMSTMLPSMR